MRRSLAFSLAAAVLLSAGPAFAQRPVPPRAKAFETAPDIPFDASLTFLKFPADLYLGEGIGVATNSKGHVYAYTRSGESSRLFEFDPSGNFLREIGHGLYGFAMAHAVRVDSEDNIWAVDEGTDMVIKFSPEGRVLMTIGRRPESHGFNATPPRGAPAPPAQPYRLGRPTDVAWDAQGNIFISDGYTNHRVVKYDKNGMYVDEVGSSRRGSAPSQFSTPHGIATDANGNVYVADRGNRRVQVFSNDLVLRAIYDHVGAPWSVCITPGPHQYLYSANSNPDNNQADIAEVSGEIYKMELDGRVVGKFGVAGKGEGQFTTVHAIDCRNENDLFIAEITGWRVQRLTLKPQALTASTR